MLQIFILSFSLLVAFATALPHEYFVSTLTARQVTGSPWQDCNATCAAFNAMANACIQPKCGCNVTSFQIQVDCLVCQIETPIDAFSAQFLLDDEIRQCHDDGVPISFKFQFPPDVQDLIDKFYRDSASLKEKQMTFLALQIIGGHVGLVIVLGFAIFSRKVHRDPTFFNFCITWIFSSVVYSIMLYHGTEGHTVGSPLGGVSPHVCLAQAALTNGAQIMTACSTMSLVIQLWIGLKTAIHGDPFNSPRHKQAMTLLLLAAPYVLFFAFTISSVFAGRSHVNIGGDLSSTRVTTVNFYCSVLELNSLLRGLYGMTLGLLVITLVFDIFIIVILYRHWRALRHIQAKSGVSLSLLLRVILFSLYRVVVAITYGTVLDKPPNGSGTSGIFTISYAGVPIWVDMLQAAIPLVAFLVFGTNTEMFRTLMFWQKNNDQQKLP